MKELIRSNDMVLLSFVEALLSDAGIGHALLDVHMSVMEGSLGVLPRRVVVAEDDWPRAAAVLTAAGVDPMVPDGG